MPDGRVEKDRQKSKQERISCHRKRRIRSPYLSHPFYPDFFYREDISEIQSKIGKSLTFTSGPPCAGRRPCDLYKTDPQDIPSYTAQLRTWDRSSGLPPPRRAPPF